MQTYQLDAAEAANRAEHEAHAAQFAPNRHERRAITVMERREAMKRIVAQRVAPAFYGTASTFEIIGG
jgi:hypothetical protein